MKIVSGLAEGQVLQRHGAKGAGATLQGTSTENGLLRVTLLKGITPLKGWNKRTVGSVVRGKFTAKLSGIPVGGPYKLRLESGSDSAEITAFYVGDIWIMAGQSNMQGVGNMTEPAKPHPLVRNFSMRREWRLAEDTLHFMPESPDSCHAATQCSPKEGERQRRALVKGVGAGIFFARDILKRSGGVPQGLISAAHGGTSMQQWDPARKKLKGASLYWSMLESVRQTGQPVAGLLWYQGESDANPAEAAMYIARMKKLVAFSRRDLALPKLPWIIVQIGRFFTDESSAPGWNKIREAQRLLPSLIKNFDTVPAIDLAMDDAIHIGSAGFPQLGARLAAAADRLVYGSEKVLRTPQLRSVKIIDAPTRPAPVGMEVTFDNVEGDLCSTGEPSGFELRGQDGGPRNIIFKTTLHGNKVRLHLDKQLGTAVQVYYGYGLSPYCNITDSRGFSLPAFGPYPLGDHKPKGYVPYLTKWNYTGIIASGTRLDRYKFADVKKLPTKAKDYAPAMAGGLINEHPAWEAKSGLAFFRTNIRADEAMKLDVLMGYDGPFRLWIDGKLVFIDMKGTNPCYADQSCKTVALKPGTHDITIGMDLNNGSAWGFFLRFARRDISRAQVESGDFAKPVQL